MPEPGSHEYDKHRARLRKKFDNQGVPDQQADDRANDVLQGRIPAGTAEPRSRREAGTGRACRGRGSG
jgi:hypothetical protein